MFRAYPSNSISVTPSAFARRRTTPTVGSEPPRSRRIRYRRLILACWASAAWLMPRASRSALIRMPSWRGFGAMVNYISLVVKGQCVAPSPDRDDPRPRARLGDCRRALPLHGLAHDGAPAPRTLAVIRDAIDERRGVHQPAAPGTPARARGRRDR